MEGSSPQPHSRAVRPTRGGGSTISRRFFVGGFRGTAGCGSFGRLEAILEAVIDVPSAEPSRQPKKARLPGGSDARRSKTKRKGLNHRSNPTYYTRQFLPPRHVASRCVGPRVHQFTKSSGIMLSVTVWLHMLYLSLYIHAFDVPIPIPSPRSHPSVTDSKAPSPSLFCAVDLNNSPYPPTQYPIPN